MFTPLLGVAAPWSGVVLFIAGLVFLVLGYMTYGRFVEHVLQPDDRVTPGVKFHDGVDYVVLPHWKNMLIQLLNIAGIGPVIGVIAGIKFGSIVFILIPLGNIIGGATHDFISGMASLRNRGGNLPGFIKITLGQRFYWFFSTFVVLLLLLVVAVFINVPAKLIDNSIVVNHHFFWWAVLGIFTYYILATMLPVDKIIGKLYPIFGGVLLLGSIGLLISLLISCFKDPTILLESERFTEYKGEYLLGHPIVPCLFVTIACGILSGFHATQSPIIARTMRSEREARSSFYGMMVLEGVIAMIWAGAALAVYNSHMQENVNFWIKSANDVLPIIANDFLGKGFGLLTVVAVIILAITSGDTAMRSLRLSLAEMLNINQQSIKNRVFLCSPLTIIISLLLFWSNQDNASFGKLWNYFAWGNQVLAASTLGAGCVWLLAKKRIAWISAIPCFYMTFIVVTFILWTSTEKNGPAGFGMDLHTSYICGGVIAGVYLLWCIMRGLRFAKNGDLGIDDVTENEASENDE